MSLKSKHVLSAKLTEMVNNPQFAAQLAKAQKRPTSKSSKSILLLLMSILNFAGKKSTYGALECQEAVKKVCTLSRRYGSPSLFLTTSFDDINNPAAF